MNRKSQNQVILKTLQSVFTLEQQVEKGFNEFHETLVEACVCLKLPFELIDKDTDAINFEINHYHFTLDWELFEKPLLGGVRILKVPRYRLCAWETIPATRHAPEEQVDKTIVETEVLHLCVKEVLLAVAKEDIRQVLEGVGYARQLKEEKEMEEM